MILSIENDRRDTISVEKASEEEVDAYRDFHTVLDAVNDILAEVTNVAEKSLYLYEGAVKIFNDIVISRWKGKTYATSEKRARVNLAYQCKKRLGRSSDTHILLPGSIIEVPNTYGKL